MRRFVVPIIGAVALLCAGPLAAQPPLEPKDGKVTITVTVHPALPLKPLSRMLLLPEYKDSIPGNRAHMFIRCFAEQDQFFGPESLKREKWNSLPLADLPDDQKDYGARLLGRDAADAARMTHVDWQLWSFIRRDGIDLLLPDLQKMRALAHALQTRARGQVKSRNFVGAVATLRTMYGLAKTLDTHPTLIGQLVGIAIASIACNVAEEMVQQPGCPNLYWSFTDLPAPFMDLRSGFQGERVIVVAHFEAILEGPVTEIALAKVVQTVDTIITLDGEGPKKKGPPTKTAAARYAEWAADAKRVEAARARLVETGLAADAVKNMSAAQVVIADDVQQLTVFTDELFKWMVLPLWEIGPVKDVEAALAKAKPDLILAPMLLPAATKIKHAQARLDQRVAYLRIIEAIRMHAYLNSGHVPDALADIKLPMPTDPVTGKPFAYEIKEGVATLTGGNPTPSNASTNRVYEFRVQK